MSPAALDLSKRAAPSFNTCARSICRPAWCRRLRSWRWAIYLAEGTQAPATSTEVSPIDFTAEAAWWENLAEAFTSKTRFMWRDGWFRDYDSVAREWLTEQDAMHLAPVFCGAAGWDQVEQLRPYLSRPPRHSSGWAPLSWPPVVMTLVGAAAAARMPLDAAELAYRFIDASYRSTDRREVDEQGGLPGVTREYRQTATASKWGETDYVNGGIEGYGWGALGVFLLIRYLLGLGEEEAGVITVAPVLPRALRRNGASYKLSPLPWGKYTLSVECMVRDAQGYIVRVRCARPEGEEIAEASKEGELLPPARMQECEWEGVWGERRTLLLPQLTATS